MTAGPDQALAYLAGIALAVALAAPVPTQAADSGVSVDLRALDQMRPPPPPSDSLLRGGPVIIDGSEPQRPKRVKPPARATVGAPAAAVAQPADTASLATAERQTVSITFAALSVDLPSDIAGRLAPTIAALNGDKNRRLQLDAYAATSAEREDEARRLSLSRALVVRQHLVDHGIAAERIDIRALGAPGRDPADRVDLLLDPE